MTDYKSSKKGKGKLSKLDAWERVGKYAELRRQRGVYEDDVIDYENKEHKDRKKYEKSLAMLKVIDDKLERLSKAYKRDYGVSIESAYHSHYWK